MEQEKLKSLIESLLFVSGEPLKVKKIAAIAGAGSAEAKAGISALRESLAAGKSGLRLIEKDGEIQLTTSPENSEYVNVFLKSEMEQKLSRASLETLAIVAYRGPIARISIEEIRGVNCTFTLRYLLLRGLVERIENPRDSRSWLYQISFDFLKKLNLGKKENLPGYEELKMKEGNPT
jgi:segregation and condensation protein B